MITVPVVEPMHSAVQGWHPQATPKQRWQTLPVPEKTPLIDSGSVPLNTTPRRRWHLPNDPTTHPKSIQGVRATHANTPRQVEKDALSPAFPIHPKPHAVPFVGFPRRAHHVRWGFVQKPEWLLWHGSDCQLPAGTPLDATADHPWQNWVILPPLTMPLQVLPGSIRRAPSDPPKEEAWL